MEYSEISLFADDTMLCVIGTNICDMVTKINDDLNDLNNIYAWLCDNKLSINVSKTQGIVIGSKYNVSKVNNSMLNVKINNVSIEFVNVVKYLGVKLDENLNFHAHSIYIMNKMSKKAYFLKRISKNLSLSTKLLLYKSTIAPHIDFCSTIL